MKLQYVYFFLQPQWEEERRKLEGELHQKGIRCACVDQIEEIVYPAEAILITDDRAVTKQIRKSQADDREVTKQIRNSQADDRAVTRQIRNLQADDRADAEQTLVCVGCDRNSFSFFDGAELVTDDLGSLDAQVLEELFCHAHGYPVTVASTERLELREISEPDFDRLYEISRQAHMEYAWPDPDAAAVFERERLCAYISNIYRLCGYGLWSVWKKDGSLIGCCGLTEQEEHLELQYMLDEAFQGQGYALEMCKAALRCAALRTDWKEIWIRVDHRNVRSRRLAERLGFRLYEENEKEVLLYLKELSEDVI